MNAPPRPVALPVNTDGIPAELIALPQWVLWRYMWRTKTRNWTKVPYQQTGSEASSTDPATWCEYQTALAAYHSGDYDGLGFVFSKNDPYTGVDLDDCRDPETGEIKPWGLEIIRALDSYCEVSPSKTGVKLWLRGKLPPGARNRTAYQDGEVEMYSERRFFVVTGEHVLETPATIEERQAPLMALHARIFNGKNGSGKSKPKDHPSACADDAALVERARKAKNGEKFSRLWSGDASGYRSDSEANLALCSILAFQTGNDAAQIDRLFRQSGMMREKWNRNDYRERTIRAACESSLVATGEPLPPEFSEESLALEIASRYWRELRFVDKWGCWMCWDGFCWHPDETLSVRDRVRRICRESASKCQNVHLAKRIASKATVYGVEGLARADRRFAATVEQWNRDPWMLNTPAGVVDLRTGKSAPALPENYCTKITSVGMAGECPLWHKFLTRVTNGDESLQRFLQKVCGYALTGITREHALFFFYGTGANGKSVFLNTISGLLGDYARTAPIDTFMASHNEHHPTDLAGLQGARLVTAVETEDGRRWAESKLKTLTGGEPISARFMRQDYFDFIPQFKLIFASNHKPELRTVDEAIRRRLHLVPFTVTIPEPERDPELGEKLRAEWSGILRWMVEGCLAWQRDRLKPPGTVRNATKEYFADEDAFGRWLDECCRTGKRYVTAGGVLFESFRGWAELNKEFVGTQKWFVQQLQGHAFTRTRLADSNGTRAFSGLALKTDNDNSCSQDDFPTDPTRRSVIGVTRACTH